MNGKWSEKLDQMLGQLVTDPSSSRAVLLLEEVGRDWMEGSIAGGVEEECPKDGGGFAAGVSVVGAFIQSYSFVAYTFRIYCWTAEGGRGEIVIHKYCFKHSPNSASFNPPNSPEAGSIFCHFTDKEIQA